MNNNFLKAKRNQKLRIQKLRAVKSTQYVYCKATVPMDPSLLWILNKDNVSSDFFSVWHLVWSC